MTVTTLAVPLRFPEGANLIVGQSHFVKTVEDLYEALVGSAPGIQFGVAFSEASGPCLVRVEGTDEVLQRVAAQMALDVAAGHTFYVVLGNAFPIHVLPAVRACPEVCRVFCATANPVQVIVAETAQGRGILGVVDGSSPQGLETAADVAQRRLFLRTIGYKRA
jgi:adenosine/AMP kinase